MKKLIVVFLIVLLVLTVASTAYAGKPDGKPCPWRNKHCRPTALPTATVTTIMRPGPVGTGTPVYTCLSLRCETPGK